MKRLHQSEEMDRRRYHTPTERMQEYKKATTEIAANGQKLLRCSYEGCDKVLTSSPGLRYHMRSHYGNDRPYSCLRCKKTFKSANGLKYHTEKTRCELSIDSLTANEKSLLCTEEPFPEDEEEVDVVTTPQPLDMSHGHVHNPTNRASAPSSLAIRQRTVSEPYCATFARSPCDLTLSPAPYCMDLSSPEQDDIVSPLTQLAIIATSPVSPLVHNNHDLPVHQRVWRLADYERVQSFNASIHSYAKPPQARLSPIISRKRSLSFSGDDLDLAFSASSDEDSGQGLSSEPSTSSDDVNNNQTFHQWPVTRWQCFISGTRVRIENGRVHDWKPVDDEGFEERYLTCGYAPHGLQLTHIISKTPVLTLQFTPFKAQDTSALFAQCQLDHPFFVIDKGWCSCSPSHTDDHYGIRCSTLEVGDVCLPPNHPDASFTVDAVHSFESFHFTPADSKAVFALSQMAKSRKESLSRSLEELSASFPMTEVKSWKKKHPQLLYHKSAGKAKRPMNAFMLFAKKHRIEYTHMYPGKDNRAISVLLGDRWKKMKCEERRSFSLEAKNLADQYKKVNPDCWKRKRSVSESCIP